MRVKNRVFSIMAVAAMSAFMASARAPELSSLTLEERARVELLNQEREENAKREQIMALLANHPTLTMNEAREIFSFKQSFEIKHYELKKDGAQKSSTYADAVSLLTDPALWKKLSWASYDQLPDPIREVTLSRMFEANARVLNSQFNVDYAAFMHIPEPVLLAKYFREISQDTRSWNPKAPEEKLRLLDELAISIMLSESFATRRGVVPYDGTERSKAVLAKSDVGLMQLSPFAREKLRRMAQFRGMPDEEFLSPDTSIKAGTYWLKQCFSEAGGDVLTAVGCYNAGINDSIKETGRALAYRETVMDRLARYVQFGQSKTFTFALEKARNTEEF